jgi:Bardet-Biedl syndrome 9 protein
MVMMVMVGDFIRVGKDLFCVQSFDGQLAFYEQDHFMFARFMTNFLVPGPLCYSKSMDCFITFNSHLEVCAYK